MPKQTDLGVYVKENKTFYYLEYGENYVNNTLDRVKKTLIQRNILKTDVTNRISTYDVISYKEAFESSLDMTPIYISKHIQSLLEKTQTKSKKGNFK